METASLARKTTSPCVFIHRHCRRRRHHGYHHHVHRHHNALLHHHHHHHHHHHLFNNRQHSCHNPESQPDASPGMTQEQGDGLQIPSPQPAEENDEDEEEPVFMLTDEWREFFAKRSFERKQAKNRGRNMT